VPPIPTITPPFISDTVPGKDPLTVRAGVPVEFDEIYTPELIVTTSLLEPFQPLAEA
jgi:hypothetical protein